MPKFKVLRKIVVSTVNSIGQNSLVPLVPKPRLMMLGSVAELLYLRARNAPHPISEFTSSFGKQQIARKARSSAQ